MNCQNNSTSFLINEIKGTFPNIPHFAGSAEGDDVLFPLTTSWSDDDSKVILVAGGNASGKSALTSFIQAIAKQAACQTRSCSMRNRTASGFQSKMIFGDESRSSTGACTVGAVKMGLESSINSPAPAVMILDEPDLDLSEECSMAMGAYIAQCANAEASNLRLIVVVSHSRALFRDLMANLSQPAHKVFVGDANRSFDAWLDGPIISPGVDYLLNLQKLGHDKFKAYLALNTNESQGHS